MVLGHPSLCPPPGAPWGCVAPAACLAALGHRLEGEQASSSAAWLLPRPSGTCGICSVPGGSDAAARLTGGNGFAHFMGLARCASGIGPAWRPSVRQKLKPLKPQQARREVWASPCRAGHSGTAVAGLCGTLVNFCRFLK